MFRWCSRKSSGWEKKLKHSQIRPEIVKYLRMEIGMKTCFANEKLNLFFFKLFRLDKFCFYGLGKKVKWRDKTGIFSGRINIFTFLIQYKWKCQVFVFPLSTVYLVREAPSVYQWIQSMFHISVVLHQTFYDHQKANWYITHYRRRTGLVYDDKKIC